MRNTESIMYTTKKFKGFYCTSVDLPSHTDVTIVRRSDYPTAIQPLPIEPLIDSRKSVHQLAEIHRREIDIVPTI